MSARIKSQGRTVVISHREYLTDVVGEVEFTWDSHVVNPGLSTSFPWLSAIAQRFETYRFRRLDFEYVPRCAATSAGAVMIIMDYDVDDLGPETLKDAMSFAHTVRGSAWQELRFRTTQSDRETGSSRKFTRSTSEFDQADRLSDQGTVYISVDGCTASAALGEVWVDYEVELFTPQLESAAVAAAPVLGAGTVIHTATGNLDGGILKGLTKTRQECQELYGLDASLADGVLTMYSPWQGLIQAKAISAAAPGGLVSKGWYDLSVPGCHGERCEFVNPALNVDSGGAGAATSSVDAYRLWPGDKLRFNTTNAVAPSAESTLTFTALSDAVMAKLFGSSSWLKVPDLTM